MNWLFASGGQTIGASASTSVLLVNIQGWFPLGLTGLISLLSKGFSRIFPALQSKSINSSVLSLSGPTVTSARDYWKNHSFGYMGLCRQSDLSFFNILSRFVIAFLSRSKCLLISWLQSQSTVILEPKKIKSVTVFTFFPIYLPWSDGNGFYDLSFLNVELSQLFHSPRSPSSRDSLVLLRFLP